MIIKNFCSLRSHKNEKQKTVFATNIMKSKFKLRMGKSIKKKVEQKCHQKRYSNDKSMRRC